MQDEIRLLPFCFFNLINSFMAILLGFTGTKVEQADVTTPLPRAQARVK